MQNKKFWFYQLKSFLPLTIGYLFLLGIIKLLTILYYIPKSFFWDVIRFSLPFLVIWFFINSYQSAKRLKAIIKDGGVQTQYGGEIDVLPTLLHLLGIDSRDYIQFGTDLFSSKHDQVVAFRNEDFITPKYTVVGNTIYQNSTGKILTHPSQKVKDEIKKDREKVNTELSLSDTLNNKNLLRFYIPTGFTPVDPKKYNYTNQYGQILKIQEDLGKKSTSLWSKNGNKTTIDDYSSDAPELTTTDQNEANVSSVKNTLKSNKKESIDTSSSSAESDSDQ